MLPALPGRFLTVVVASSVTDITEVESTRDLVVSMGGLDSVAMVML
jgi:hypothetical protein